MKTNTRILTSYTIVALVALLRSNSDAQVLKAGTQPINVAISKEGAPPNYPVVPEYGAPPVVRCIPPWHVVKLGSDATFTVQMENPALSPPQLFIYQWQRQGPGGTNFENFVDIPGATNMSYTIYSATTNDGPTGPAYFLVKVSSPNGPTTASVPAGLLVGTAGGKKGGAVYGAPIRGTATLNNAPPDVAAFRAKVWSPERPTISSLLASLLVGTASAIPTPVYGSPTRSSGNLACPGSFVGYVSFVFYPDHTGGITFHNAKDLTRADTKLEAYNYGVFHYCNGPTNCPNTHVPPQSSPETGPYIFTIYFPNNFPSGTYPIYQTGFQ